MYSNLAIQTIILHIMFHFTLHEQYKKKSESFKFPCRKYSAFHLDMNLLYGHTENEFSTISKHILKKRYQ